MKTMHPPGRFLAGHLSAFYVTPATALVAAKNSTNWKKLQLLTKTHDSRLFEHDSSDDEMSQIHLSRRRRNAMIISTENSEHTSSSDEHASRMTKMQKVSSYARVVLPHIALISATLVYIIAGASVFAYIEKPYELDIYRRHFEQYRMVVEHIGDWNRSGIVLEDEIDRFMEINFRAFEAGLKPTDLRQLNNSTRWTTVSSIFFTTTVLTSIGYGNLIPISTHGQIFCMCYAIFGIPLTLITIADVAKFVADMLIIEPTEEVQTCRQLMVLVLLLGYMAVSALVYSFVEPAWSYIDSFYFCLVSLMTVGFGDLHPAGSVEYMTVSMVFLFAGLVITTLAVDVSGSVCIDKIHSLGRGFDALRVLKALRQK